MDGNVPLDLAVVHGVDVHNVSDTLNGNVAQNGFVEDDNDDDLFSSIPRLRIWRHQ